MLASQDVPVGSLSGHAAKNGTYIFNITLIIKDTQQLSKIIRDLLMETEEWKALPEYEFFYD